MVKALDADQMTLTALVDRRQRKLQTNSTTKHVPQTIFQLLLLIRLNVKRFRFGRTDFRALLDRGEEEKKRLWSYKERRWKTPDKFQISSRKVLGKLAPTSEHLLFFSFGSSALRSSTRADAKLLALLLSWLSTPKLELFEALIRLLLLVFRRWLVELADSGELVVVVREITWMLASIVSSETLDLGRAQGEWERDRLDGDQGCIWRINEK